MSPTPPETIELATTDDVVRARQVVRRCAVAQGFGLVDQTRVVTAVSELARNTVIHGGGGRMHVEQLADGERRGLRVAFADDGPGIADLARALQDGWTSGGGLGLGLGGARRLVDDFDVTTEVGVGTTVTVARWG